MTILERVCFLKRRFFGRYMRTSELTVIYDVVK
ncbi:hypothetical protein PaelaDRAFT_2601 [Paenibacillus lactis 154]|uniref:Uncharacterized protein n=1 Tax=Paenibacillus lactis 154 TaxID=743719 RepID=G4HF40_9BACL|nr:hypothetical protein PaelaDRAFT_2601 [Paenibacillus lactis 154]